MLVLSREKAARNRAKHATDQRAPRSDHRAPLGACGCSPQRSNRATELLIAGLGLRCAHRVACVALCLFLRGSAEPLRSRVLLVLTEADERRRAPAAAVIREVGANSEAGHAYG